MCMFPQQSRSTEMTLKNELTSIASESEEHPNHNKAWATVTPDGGEFETGTLPEPLTGDWTAVLTGFGLDPAIFEVAGDTVRMSKWQSSKRLENGDRDVIWLYSYRASFKRRTVPVLADSELDVLRKKVSKWIPAKRKAVSSDETPCTFVCCWADWQLGKSAGGGVDATVKRILQSFDATVERVVELRKIGRNIEEIVVAQQGDPIEMVDGHYASQTFTVELNLRSQLLIALDMFCKGLITFAGLAKRVRMINTLCNHGEWMRRGGKSITGDSDNAGGFLADATQRILENNPATSHIEFLIPQDEMMITAILSGVSVAFSHNHKMTGKPLEFLRGQAIRILREEGREPDLFVTAHRHHLSVVDHGPFTELSCPPLDGGSKWYTDTSGNFSTPGTLTFLVGKHDARNFSDIQVL